MKPSQRKQYSMLFLKGAQKGDIEASWPTILHNAYLFSKDIVTWFPLPRGLIESVDRIFDSIIADLGTKYLGVWYLPNSDETNVSRLMRGAKHFITDDANILRLSLGRRKPCIYFSRRKKQCVFILKNNTEHEIWAKNLGFLPAEIIHYDHQHRYRDRGILFGSIPTRQIKFHHCSTTLQE